jgi:hypothetical protein
MASSPSLPEGCYYTKLTTHLAFWIGIVCSTLSLRSCAFLNVHWIGDDKARVSGVGLFSFYDQQSLTCIPYWTDEASSSDTDLMTLLDGMHFFFGLFLGLGGLAFGCLAAILLLVHHCKGPQGRGGSFDPDAAVAMIRIQTWSRLCAITSVFFQAGTIGAMFLTVPGEHVCNAKFSTCHIGVGGIYSIMAVSCYSIGAAVVLYMTWCDAGDRIVHFPNHYEALNTDNELEESFLMDSGSGAGSTSHVPYNYGDLPPWVNPANNNSKI